MSSPRTGLAWLGGSFATACLLSITRTIAHQFVFDAATRRGDYKSIEALSKAIGIISSSLSFAAAVAAVIGLVLLVRSLRSRSRGLLVAALSLQALLCAISLTWPVAWLMDSRSGSLARVFDWIGIAHGCLYLAFILTLATGLVRAARSLGVQPPTALAVVAIVVGVVETAYSLSIDAFASLDHETRNILFAIGGFLWPVVAAILTALVLSARASFASAPSTQESLSDPNAQAAARGLTMLRTVAWVRIGFGILATVLLRAMIASDAHDAGKAVAWFVLIVGVAISLAVISALHSIGRLPLARGPATATLILVVLAIPVDSWTTLLTTRVMVKPTSFWDSSLHEAMEAARTLPAAMVVSSIVSIASAILLFVTLASVARSIGDSGLEQRANSTIWIASAAFILVGIGQVGTLQGWISIPVLLLTAVGGLVLAITVLARVMGILSSLSARLSS